MRKNKQKKLDSLETENEITTQNDYNGEKKEPERHCAAQFVDYHRGGGFYEL